MPDSNADSKQNKPWEQNWNQPSAAVPSTQSNKKPWEQSWNGSPEPEVEKSKGFGGHVRDIGASLAAGAAALPDVAIGIGDILTGGAVGKALDDSGVYTTGSGAKYWQDKKTDIAKEQSQQFSDAEGIWDKTKVALSNPTLITNTVAESLPTMVAGGLVGRGLNAATKGAISPMVGGAIGEGTMMAGGQAEQIRQQTDDGLLNNNQVAASVATGALGTLFGMVGGAVAKKFGFGDVDSMLAGANANQIAGEISKIPLKSVPKHVIAGALSEGLLEELPQSVQEQVLQNYALNKDLMDGVDDAIVMGTLAGMAMGGTASGLNVRGHNQRYKAQEQLKAAQQQEQADAEQQAMRDTQAQLFGSDTPAPVLDPSKLNPFSDNTLPASPVIDMERLAPADGNPRYENGVNFQPTPVSPELTLVDDNQVIQSENGIDFVQPEREPTALERQIQFNDTFGTETPAPVLDYNSVSPFNSNTQQPILDATKLDLAPSQRMGIDPNTGPLSAAAATAVDTGVSQQFQIEAQAQALLESKEGWDDKQGDSNQGTLEQAADAARQLTPEQIHSKQNTYGPEVTAAIERIKKQGVLSSGNTSEFLSANDGSQPNTEQSISTNDNGTGATAQQSAQDNAGTAQAGTEVLSSPETASAVQIDQEIAQVEQQFQTEKSVPKKAQLRKKLEGLKAQRAEIETQHKAIEQQTQIENAAHEAASSNLNDLPEPTQAQIEAGNYKKGHIKVHGLDIAVENPRGSERRGTDPDGKEWAHTMSDHYGYIKKTTGADNEHIDTYIGRNPESDQIFIVDQIDQKTGGFDEHKVMMGFNSQEEAIQAYSSNFDEGWKVGPVRAMTKDEFKTWLKEGDTKKPAGGTLTNEGASQSEGKTEKVYTPGTNREIEVRHKVVEADSLITSNDANGAVNPNFPKHLQPRDRSRPTSIAQVHDIASKLNPKLLGENPSTASGAPIVSGDGVVESGNGRTLAIRKAYETGKGEAYKQWLSEQGYDVSDMKNPVLVRERTTAMTDQELQEYTRESNESTTLTMSPTEQAMVDAKAVVDLLDQYRGGDINSAANRDFVNRFVTELVPTSERGKMLSAGTGLTQDGQRRINAALVAAAYNDTFIVDQVFESTESDIKAIGNALTDVAGFWAKMRDMAINGQIPKDLDVTPNLVEAVHLVQKARVTSTKLADLVAQDDIFSGAVDPVTLDFLSVFYRGDKYTRARGRERVADALNHYAQQAMQQSNGENLFGDKPKNNTQLRGETLDRLDQQETDKQQDIFASPQPDDRNTVTSGGTGQRATTESSDAETQTTEVKTDISVMFDNRDALATDIAKEIERVTRLVKTARSKGKTKLSEHDREKVASKWNLNPVGWGDFDQVFGAAVMADVAAGFGKNASFDQLKNAALEKINELYESNKPSQETSEVKTQKPKSVPEKLKQKKAEKPVEKIEDFGEKLEGARKDQWKGYAQKLEGIISDPSKIQLAKYFPEPNYDQLIADGVDPKVVGFVMAARQAVPPKPRKSWKLDSWAAKVNSLRALVQEVIAQSIPFNKLMERMEGARGLNDLVIRIEAMESVGYPLMKHMSVDLNMGQAQYSFVRDQHGNELRNVKRYFMDQSPYLHHVYETKAEMFKDLKKHLEKIQADKEALSEANDKPQAKATKFDIFQSRYGGEYYVGKSIGRHQHMLSPTFKSLKEAQEYRREHHDALVKALEDAKFIAQHRRKTNNSRIGIDHRNGENVSPEQFSQTFGFRGVQFGNYVESDKRQADLNNAYDSLMDLSKLLNIPPQAISLNGSLGLSFGARGKGGSNPAAAHFERDTVVINLTKNSGAGSLAHEWWHALDNYFSRMRKQPLEMLSDRPSSSAVLDKENANSIRQEVLKAWENLVHTIRSSDLAKRSGKLDNKRSKPYWGTMVEMTARAFEKYVIDQAATRNESNDYLANIVHEHQYPNAEQFYPYPNAIESAKIDSAYDALFDTLETEKTDQGTRLYSRAQDDVTVGQSSDQVRAALVKRFGEKTIVALEQKGKLRIVESYEVEGVEGYYHNGRVTLVANNLSESSIIPTFLHELGGHGGFQNTMSKQQYAELMRQFDEMVKRKHPIAMEAKRLAEREANSETQKLEYLPYMLTLASTMQVTNALQKSALRQFIDKVVSAVKAFLFDKMGVQLNLAPDDLVALAERMVARQTSEPTSEDRVRAQYFGTKEWMKAPNGKPSKLTEQQWLQVRTPEFKNWFGDWQNDPENASQMVDENGEPQVLYHGTPEKFYNFKLGGGLLGRGVYLTNDVNTAEMYSQIRAKTADQQGYILPLFANIRKAFEAGARTTSDLMHSDVLRERFNGIMMSLEDQVKYIVAFKPEQVKLATGNTGWFDGLVSDIRYAYAGTYAREANADTLAQAERMQNNGVPSERIRRETGWFVGMDGEWRFEIDDSQSSINEKALADLKDGMVMRIADVLNHDGLYANYPHLRNIQLLSEVSSERGGSFNRSFNPYITINEDYLNDPEMVRSILIHELQHAIQYHEGFAEGGNPKMADRVLQELRQLSHIKSRESHNAQYEAGDAIAERDAIRHQLRQLSMFESMRKLREYANMDKPSSQLRHLRNHFSTITYMDYEATSGLIQLDQETRYALRDLQHDWYAVGKRTQKQFNPRLREVSWKAAELLESLIDPQLLKQFKASDVSLKTFRNRLNKRIDRLYEQRIKEADQKKADYENFSQRLERVQRFSPHMVYMSLSGEIEARDTQERLQLNAEQRANQRPYSSQNEYTDHAIVVRDRQVDGVGISSNPLYSRQANAQQIVQNIVSNMNKQGAAKLRDKAAFKMTDALQYLLQGLGRRQLTDIYSKILPQMKRYNDTVAQMDADKNEVAARADDIVVKWAKLKDEAELASVMHEATLAQIDPAKPYQSGDSVAKYAQLKKAFDALTPEAQAMYKEARNAYSRHHREVREAIKERILRSSLSSQKKTELLQQMDAHFFGYSKGVYFPLQRFGKYVVLVRDAKGTVLSVSRAETMNEANELRKVLMDEYPNDVVNKPLLDKDFQASRDMVGRGFMTNLFNELGSFGLNAQRQAEMEDILGQLYLKSLPDLSYAKHSIHRKGTAGFSQDARRAFAQNMTHGASYLAKLRYKDQLETMLDDMQKHADDQAKINPDYDQPVAQRVINEMVKRHESLMSPDSHPLSTALTSLGFLYYLGLSPASATVNTLQTALVAYPQMGAKWGFDKAYTALKNAGIDFAKGFSAQSMDPRTWEQDIAKVLKGDELKAYKEAVRRGTIDVTMAHDLAGVAQGEDSGVMRKIAPLMKGASWMFHKAERFNREVTFIAGYRLARDAGASHDDALEQAIKATYDGHFDYSSSNRPRIMQGNIAKVVLLFKQFGQNMLYTLIRTTQQAFMAETPAARTEARKALAGILATHFLAAGALGLPLIGPLLTMASWMGGDEDEPWDAEVALRNALADAVGNKTAEVLMKGVSRLGPADLSGRVGINNLLVPDTQDGLEGKELSEATVAAFLGPVVGIMTNVFKGMNEIGEGHGLRGVETMAPVFARSPLRAYRYAEEGNMDKTGVMINEDVGIFGVLSQAMGFSPSEVRLASEGRSAIYQHTRRLDARRSQLMSEFARAMKNGDKEEQDAVWSEIQAFNEKNLSRRINRIQAMQSLRQREKRVREAENGVYLPRKKRDDADVARFAFDE